MGSGLSPLRRRWQVFLTRPGAGSAALPQHGPHFAPRAGQRGPHAQRLSPLQPCPPPRGPRQAGQQPSSCEPREDGAVLRAQERFGGAGGQGRWAGHPRVESGLGWKPTSGCCFWVWSALYQGLGCRTPHAVSLNPLTRLGHEWGPIPQTMSEAPGGEETASHMTHTDLTPSPSTHPLPQTGQWGLGLALCCAPSPGTELRQPAAEGAALPQRHLRHLRRLHPQPRAVSHL